MRGSYATALVALLVLVAGCSGAGLGSNAQQAPDGGAPVDAEAARSAEVGGGGSAPQPEAPAAENDGGSAGTVPQVRTRQLIKTAEVKLRVDDYDRARERLTRAAERRGGFVGDASARRHTTGAGNYTTGTVTFRVPNDEFEAFLRDVNETGTVLSSQQNTKDVTDKLVDIEARLRNLRAQRDQLRRIYRRANTTEDVLRVQRRLSEVQTKIEQLEAQKKSLKRRVALSTVTVRIKEPRPEPEPDPEPPAWYETPLVEAFLASVDGVVVTVQALGVLAAYALPYLVTFVAPPVAGLVIAWRRWGGRIRGDDGASASGDPPAGTDAAVDDADRSEGAEPGGEQTDDAEGGDDADADGEA